MATAIAKRLNQAQSALTATRRRNRERAQSVERSVTSFGVGFAYGLAKRKGLVKAEFFGVPTPIALSVGSHFVGMSSGGALGRLGSASGDALAAVAGAELGESGAIISGHDY